MRPKCVLDDDWDLVADAQRRRAFCEFGEKLQQGRRCEPVSNRYKDSLKKGEDALLVRFVDSAVWIGLNERPLRWWRRVDPG